MTRDRIQGMTSDELRNECARRPEYGAVLGVQKYLALAAVWPLWEATCKHRPSWALSASQGGVVIADYGTGGEQRIIVPSGNPADAIRRAFLLAGV